RESPPQPGGEPCDPEGHAYRPVDGHDQAPGLRDPPRVPGPRDRAGGQGRHRRGHGAHVGHGVSRPPVVTLRPAVLDDCPVLWRWRNDPETRQASVDEREIPVDTHTRWFEETLKRFDRKLFIVSADGVDAGMVRLDIQDRDAAVSVNIVPEWRGRGVGPRALGCLSRAAFRPLALLRMSAVVKRENAADLIERLGRTAARTGADALVRITADCPLVDPALVDRVVGVWRRSAGRLEYVSNVFPPTFPDGLDVEVLSRTALERLDREVSDPFFRESLTAYVREHPAAFEIANVEHPEDLSRLRWTMDYPEDLAFVEAVYRRLGNQGEIFGMDDLLRLLEWSRSEERRVGKECRCR